MPRSFEELAISFNVFSNLQNPFFWYFPRGFIGDRTEFLRGMATPGGQFAPKILVADEELSSRGGRPGWPTGSPALVRRALGLGWQSEARAVSTAWSAPRV
jgi:hypothetical protein